MNFLFPAFLFGALAIAAPIIYHLIRRTTRERTVFSSLMFLLPSPPRLTKKSRLEDILLLLLRCAALALLAFAFARPFLRTSGLTPPAPDVARKTVILLDMSASMQRTGLWADAQAEALAAVRRASPVDEVAVLAFDRAPRTLLGFEEWKTTSVDQRAALAANRIEGIAPTWKATNLGNALIAAAEAMEETEQDRAPGPREIVLISDLQAGSQLSTLQAYEWPKGIQLSLKTVKARSPSNAALQLVAEAPDTDPKAAPAVRVRVSNNPNSTKDQFQVGWARPDAPQSIVGEAIRVTVFPSQSTIVRVPAPVGTAVQQIVLLGDDEPFDNTVYAVPPEKQQAKVFYFGREPAGDREEQPLFWLRAATTSIEDARTGISLLTPAAGAPLVAADVQDAKLFFVTDQVDAAVAATLRTQMEAGKTVVVAPKSADLGGVISQLLGGIPVTLREGVPPRSGSRSTVADYAILGEIEYQHPLFAVFNDPRYSDFSKIHFYKHRQLVLDGLPEPRVLARFDNRNPAVVEIPVGRGRLVCLLAGWHKSDSDMARSSRFLPFIASLLELSGSLGSQVSQFAVGDPIPVISIAGTSEMAMSIVPPGGPPVSLAAGTASFLATDKPGIYELGAGERRARIGINLDSAESRTSPLPADELERYGAPGAEPIVNAEHVARKEALLQGNEAEGRQKLWRWFIVLTLVVLLGESALAGWTARRNAASVSTGGVTP